MTAEQPECARKGCTRTVPPGGKYDTCTVTCAVVHRHTVEADRIATVIGGYPAQEILDAAADLTDSYDHLLRLRRNLKLQATAAGISDRAWVAIVRGEHQ
jgi:hypothetical protein